MKLRVRHFWSEEQWAFLVWWEVWYSCMYSWHRPQICTEICTLIFLPFVMIPIMYLSSCLLVIELKLFISWYQSGRVIYVELQLFREIQLVPHHTSWSPKSLEDSMNTSCEYWLSEGVSIAQNVRQCAWDTRRSNTGNVNESWGLPQRRTSCIFRVPPTPWANGPHHIPQGN